MTKPKFVMTASAAIAFFLFGLYSTSVKGSNSPQTPLPAAPPSTQAPAEPQSGATPRAGVDAAATHGAVLKKYCVTCHNERLKTAGLLLDSVNLGQVGQHAEVLEKVLRKLREHSMPPPNVTRPEPAAYDQFADWLEGELDTAAAAHVNPGRPSIHRLNRTEYVNAIRDLLALEVNGAALLPADDSSYGFDNIADVLTISPTLLERYLVSAQRIARLAVGDPSIAPAFDKYTVSTFLQQDDRMSEDQPFGARGGTSVPHHFPLDGEYVLRVRLQRTFEDSIRGLETPHDIDVFVDGERVKTFSIGGGEFSKGRNIGVEYVKEDWFTADKALEVRFPAKAGTRVLTVTFPQSMSYPEEAARPKPALTSFAWAATTRGPQAVSTIEIGGPFNATGPGDTPSRRAIFSCRPSPRLSEAACARQILSTLGRRAYRRSVTARDLRTLEAMYEAGRSEGGFEVGIERALARMLVAPEFLFRLERDPMAVMPGTAYRLSDLELASRLSFFLWSSIPDEQLLDVAARGRLKDPIVLDRQVRRMLADPRSRSLVTNFAGQWLWLRNLDAAAPNPDIFPQWDDSLREAFRTETELFLDSMIRGDRSVLDLLNADYTFVNERLAEHYGIPNVYGSHFRRVQITDPRRRGLFGQGSILTVTSYADRTSPVKRGAFVLENILAAPPPPPPPNVPSLPENQQNGKVLTMRERMAQHRRTAVCASCHARIDPIGFALENYDAIGRWRTNEGGSPIDASGTLLDGTKFDGIAQMRESLLAHPGPFVEALAEKLLTYAVGRGVEYYDKPQLRSITRAAARNNYRWSSLVLGIVKSAPFQMRQAPPPESPAVSVGATVASNGSRR